MRIRIINSVVDMVPPMKPGNPARSNEPSLR
jgi:hypothetical protein